MPIDIHGKLYRTVAERLKDAHGVEHEPPTGIQSIETRPVQVGNLVIVTATVTYFDGRHFDGMSLVNLSATSPAERDAPVEVAETSAVGRALAMSGWPGSEEGLAGAEEMHLAQQRSASRQPVMTPQSMPFPPSMGSGSAAPRPVGGGSSNPASPSQVRFATKLWSEAGRPLPPPDFTTYGMRDISALIDELKAAAAG